ncbi:MAG: hypothetical protein VX344_02460 [Bacteroidota bacterium]|nr:hypothetical protein [Bacteroidota bacterium]
MKNLFFIIGAFIFLARFLVSQIVVDNSATYDSPILLADNITLSAEIQASNYNFQGNPMQKSNSSNRRLLLSFLGLQKRS